MLSDPDWMIEPVEGMAFTHELSFSDEIAHERQDLVTRSVGFLAGLKDVSEAYQEDRERVHVRFAGDDEPLREAFTAWWAQASTEPPPWAEVMNAISTGVHRVLKPIGFKKKGSLFNRETEPGVIQVVELRRVGHAGAEQIRVEVGLFLERADDLLNPGSGSRPTWVSEVYCQIRQPLETNPGPEKAVFPLHEGAAPVVAFVESVVVDVLARLGTVDEILTTSGDGRARLGWLRSERRAIGAILADRDRKPEARRVLQGVFEESIPAGRRSLVDLADRLGVGPIETGSDPTLSISDEEFLASWASTQGRRIGELEQLVAEHPPSRRRLGLVRKPTGAVALDRSDVSVAALWRWLIAAVPQADKMIPDPRPLPSRYRHSLIEELSASEQHLADLVAAYLGAVVRTHRPHARWGLGPSAELGFVGPRFFPLVNGAHKAVRWLKHPPDTVENPADPRFDQLTPLVKLAITSL